MKEGDKVKTQAVLHGGEFMGEMKAEKAFTIGKITEQDRAEAAMNPSMRMSMAAPVVQKIDLKSEESVRIGVARVKADLRSLATAMEAYFIDYNTYTANGPTLTTPISYMTHIPADPFDKSLAPLRIIVSNKSPEAGQAGKQQGKKKGKRQGKNQQVQAPKYNFWTAYSVGPDQADNHAEIVFDPTNGVVSGGDIVRWKQ